MTDAYFNPADWYAIGCNAQQVRLIELLLNRTGGSAAPSLNLTEVTELTQVSETITTDSLVNEIRILKSKLSEITFLYEGQLNRLQHRINELENAQ